MNLIEKYGSYDAAKAKQQELSKIAADPQLLLVGKIIKEIGEIEIALLEYHRQHNIFEVGDKVVFRECSGIGGASDAIDLMTVKSIDAFGVRMTNSLCPWAIQIRHATDEEIKAGKRLEVKSEN